MVGKEVTYKLMICNKSLQDSMQRLAGIDIFKATISNEILHETSNSSSSSSSNHSIHNYY
jgi:hypothetical protein